MKAKFVVKEGLGYSPRPVLNRPHYGTSVNAKLRAYATYNGCSLEKALAEYKIVGARILAARLAYQNGWREWEKYTGRSATLGSGSYGG